MELEFRADGAGGELLIHLDVDGLAALLRAVETAMAEGRGELIPAGRATAGAGGAPNAFGKVIVTFEDAGASGDRSEDGAWFVPEPGPARLPLSARS